MFFLDLLYSIPGGVADGLKFALLAIGVFLTYKILDFADLTVDGSLALGGVVSAVLIAAGWNPFLVLLVAFLCGMMAGFVTAILHTKLKLPGILASILTMLSCYSINIRIMSGRANVNFGSETTLFTYITRLFPKMDMPYVTIILGVIISAIVIAVLYWYMGTKSGSALRATGNNEKMARAQGINTDTYKIIGLMISNGLVALSGYFIAQWNTGANADMGRGAIVIGLAAVIIGEMIFGKNRPFYVRLISVVVGAIIYRLIITIALLFGLQTSDLNLISAIIVVIALSIPTAVSFIKNRRGNGGFANKKVAALESGKTSDTAAEVLDDKEGDDGKSE